MQGTKKSLANEHLHDTYWSQRDFLEKMDKEEDYEQLDAAN